MYKRQVLLLLIGLLLGEDVVDRLVLQYPLLREFFKPYALCVRGRTVCLLYTSPPDEKNHDLGGSYSYLVITADKGLSGSYKQNVIKEAQRIMGDRPGNKLFVVGEYGRTYYTCLLYTSRIMLSALLDRTARP